MKQALLLFLLLAAATAHGQLFDYLDYREGVATLQINARLTNIYMYEARGEIDTIVHEFPASAVAFVYEGKEYHNVGLNDSLELVDIDYRDSVKMTITVWRDRKDLMGRNPYAEVTAIERLRAVGEIDTIGRVIGYGDTLYITHLDGRWEWRPYLTSDSKFWGLSEDELYLVLHMDESFCIRILMRRKPIRHVDYYDRGNRIWYEYLILRGTGEPNPDFTDCTIWLHEKPHGFKE